MEKRYRTRTPKTERRGLDPLREASKENVNGIGQGHIYVAKQNCKLERETIYNSPDKEMTYKQVTSQSIMRR